MLSTHELLPQELLAGLTAADWHRATVHSALEIRPLIETIAQALTAEHYSPDDVYSVSLAMEEAVTNAVRHGNRNDPQKEVRVGYHVTHERILADVEDQGPGFDPGQVANPLAPENLLRPGGRGVFLMRALMTWVWFNDRGNRVVLCKHRSAAIAG